MANDKGSELDLGVMPEKTSMECAPCGPKPCDQPRYPELCFRGKHADLFREKYGSCAPGDEYEMTLRVKVKVSGMSDDKCDDYNNRIEFCALAIVGDVVEEEASEEASEEKPKPRTLKRVTKTTVNAGY